MSIFLQIPLITGCALALCIYAGWGAACLALPASLRPQAALLIPLVGYAIAIWVGYMGVSTAMSLRWSLAVLLAMATALNMVAWRRGRRPRPLAALREHAAPLTLFAVTLLIGVLPLLHYGYATTIGEGWDTESYLPLAQHLNDYTLARIPQAPISPMRDLVRDPPRIGVTLGFSALQGTTMLLSGQTALATFAPLLALLRALGVLAVYAWLRATMGLGRWAALLGATLTSGGALLLWISYFNFGMQLAGWPLLALGLTLGVATIEELAQPPRHQDTKTQKISAWSILVPWRLGGKKIGAALLAGVALAALPVAYYPALTLWVPLAAGLGVARVLEAGRRREDAPGPLGLLVAALILGLLTLVLAAPTVLDYFEGFSFRYSLPAEHIGPDRFIAITETIGLKAFRLPDEGSQPPAALIWLASAIAATFAIAGLALPAKNQERALVGSTKNRGSSAIEQNAGSQFSFLGSGGVRLRWLGVLAAALVYLAWLRFGRPYEYGYMKGSAYAGFVAWGAIAFGAQALWPRASLAWRAGVVACAIVLLTTACWAQALTIADHWDGPANFRRDVAAFDQAADLVPPGASVAITSDASFTGPTSGLFATMLYGREIWGHLSTAYTGLNYWPEGRMPQYALLAAGERAWPLDLGGRELWRSGAAALYQLDQRTQILSGRADMYSSAPVANKNSPAALEIWRRGGANRAAMPGAPLTLLLGDTLRFGPGHPDGGTASKRALLTVASLAEQRISIASNASSNAFDIKAGVSQISLSAFAPTAITITPEQSLALIGASVVPADTGTSPSVMLDEGQVAWSATAELHGGTIQLRVQTANPGRHALRIGLTVVEDTFARPYHLVQALAAAPLDDTWQLNFDLARGATEALVGSAPTPLLLVSATAKPPDSRYFGVLELYDGEEVVAHAPVFTLAIGDGKPAQFVPIPFTVEATPAGPPTTPPPSNRRPLLDGAARELDSQATAIEQAVLARQPAWPGAPGDAPLAAGAPLTARLFWRAGPASAPPMMVSVQVLGADNHKWAQWDGVLGGDWRPVQSWRAGERVRQDVPLQLDPATPPGTYRLALVVYDPASGQPQTFGGQNSLDLGELIVH